VNPFKEKGIPLEQQVRSWKDVVLPPYQKQTVDAFTRCRIILMNGLEVEANLFSHNFARTVDDPDFKGLLAWVRRIEHQQQNTINWLNPADQSVLETTLGYEQVAIELTAYLARTEPDPYLKMAFDFGLLEDFDHLYRFGQALDLVHGKDPNEILQGRTDTYPGRPTQDHHNDPTLRILKHYDKERAAPISKVNALTLMAGEQQTMNFYKNVGNFYGSPDVRQLYAEISNVEEEHVTQYECLMDPNETWLERWVMHEFMEVANYYTCYETEVDLRIKQLWEMFLNYEIEHLRIAGEALQRVEGRDPEELCGGDLPTPATFETNRDYVNKVLAETAALRLVPGGEWEKIAKLPADWLSHHYQDLVNAAVSPSEGIVDLRIGTAGVDLVRAGDSKMIERVGEFRTTLDGHDAPNTVGPENPAPRSMDDEVARLGPLATLVDDVKAGSGKGRSHGRSKAA
jgi:rubrerythrin